MDNPTGDVIILRGLPGSGKTTLARLIARHHNVSADDYFDLFNGGVFDPSLLQKAHQWCFEKFQYGVDIGSTVITVHNTSTQEWEFQKYVDYALDKGYRVHTVVVENRHGNSSVHNVPEGIVEKMRDRFSVKL